VHVRVHDGRFGPAVGGLPGGGQGQGGRAGRGAACQRRQEGGARHG